MRPDWIEGRLFKSPLSLDDKKQIAGAYALEFGREMRGSCENCYHDALMEIYLKTRQMKDFILKSGVVFRFNGIIYSNLNLTNEAARWYLKQDANNIKHFLKIKEEVKKVADEKIVKTKKQ